MDTVIADKQAGKSLKALEDSSSSISFARDDLENLIADLIRELDNAEERIKELEGDNEELHSQIADLEAKQT